MYFITSLSNETCKTNAIKQNTSTTSKMTKIKHPKLKNPIEKQFNVVTRYHYFLFFIIFASKLPGLWHILNLIFLSPPMKYYCDSDDKSTNDSNTCPCDEPSWDRTVFSKLCRLNSEYTVRTPGLLVSQKACLTLACWWAHYHLDFYLTGTSMIGYNVFLLEL